MFRFQLPAIAFPARRRVAVAVIFAAIGIGGGNVRSQCVCCCPETSSSVEVSENDRLAPERLISWNVHNDEPSLVGILGDFGGRAFAGADRDRLFPIGGQRLGDLGYPIPLPIGVGATFLYTDQVFAVDEFRVGIGGLPPLPVPVIDLPSLPVNLPSLPADITPLHNRTSTASVRYDLWVLPFLNVYGITGYTSGITTGDVVVGEVAGLPALPVLPGLPALVRVPVRTRFEGPTYGGGFTAAVGYKKLFASVDWHYTETNLNLADSAVSSQVTTPRIGLNGPRGSIWVGASHQKIEQRLTVSNQLLGLVPIDTVTRYRTARPWNFCYGFRFLVCEHLELFVEHGFSGRNQVMGHVTVRF